MNRHVKRQTMTTEQMDSVLRERNKPVVCTTLQDIWKVVQIFQKVIPKNVVEISCDLPWNDPETKKSGVDKVIGTTVDSSMRQLLIDGLDVVKKRLESQNKLKEQIEQASKDDEFPISLTAWDVDSMRFHVDSLIERKLGGKRRGLVIYWKIEEGEFEFEPYQGKLYKVETKNET